MKLPRLKRRRPRKLNISRADIMIFTCVIEKKKRRGFVINSFLRVALRSILIYRKSALALRDSMAVTARASVVRVG